MDALYTSDGKVYTGMDKATIQRLMDETGSQATFVTKDQYDSFVSSKTSVRDVPDESVVQARADAKDSKLSADARLNALVKVLGL